MNHSNFLPRPKHGGHINKAIKQYKLDKDNCIDLSTGINPMGWPVPLIPESVYRTLPDSDNLLEIAAKYYKSQQLLATAGSQQSIEILPKILGEKLTIGIVSPTYAEHFYSWKKNGHNVLILHPHEVNENLEKLDCLLIVNPNNPTGYLFHQQQLLNYLDYFKNKAKPSYLIIDEAFMDGNDRSLIPYLNNGPLIILRSIGKFFGLAGIRCGFLFAETGILKTVSLELMPWSISHPTRWIVRQALADQKWIAQNQQYLIQQSRKLKILLSTHFGKNIKISGCSLFQTVFCDNSEIICLSLATQGIFVRLLDKKNGLRFGLPKNNKEFQQLTFALSSALKI